MDRATTGRRAADGLATWSLSDLARPVAALTVVVTVVVTVPIAGLVGCNAHEIGHALVGTAFGWEVERIVPCTPTGGGVRYRAATTKGDVIESWAGGLVGALVLVLVYTAALRRGARPLRSPIAWATGFGLLLPVGPQLVIAVLEGTNRETSYADTISANARVWIPIIVVSAGAGPAWHLWRWHGVLRLRPRR